MDEAAFKRILTTFADTPADVNLQKGHVILQMRDDIIEATVSRRDGALLVTDNGTEFTALRWIVERVARLPMLADRLLSYVEDEQHFVTPSALVTEELEVSTTESSTASSDAVQTITDLVSRDRVGTAGVVYLVSDAGEGKTTAINTVARRQAALYKQKRTGWLLLPVLLGGRPFLRLDDVVAAALLNRFRFPLFFDSFIELVRLGVIVPAFDGFEEMFVESAAGDAASALGNLLGLLQSAGTVLVAARQAYFDYKNLDTQARLYDALSQQSVSFSCVRLQRWTADQFVAYARKRGLASPDQAYESLASVLGGDHPLLTRAVLAAKILDLVLVSEDIEDVVRGLDAGASDYFGELVRPILSRESLKWLDKSGEPYHPLLSTDEHIQLMEAVALEMWTVETAIVPADILEWAAESFCASRQKSATVTRQVLERIKQHALLVNKAGTGRNAYQFDHEEFSHYFLGRAVATLLVHEDDSAIRAALRRTSLPQLSVEAAAVMLKAREGHLHRAVSRASHVCRTEPSASFVRENAGAIVIKALHESRGGPTTVEGLAFPRDSLSGREFRELTFANCDFAETEVDEGAIRNAVFRSCRFDLLFIRSTAAFSDTIFDDCDVKAVAAPGSSVPTYDPVQIGRVLERFVTIPGRQAELSRSPAPSIQPDESLRHTEKVLRRFLRSTELNENVVRQAVGEFANQFFRDVLPVLTRHGILREVPYLGAGHQRRFKLARPLQQLSDALKQSAGDFDRFVSLSGGYQQQR